MAKETLGTWFEIEGSELEDWGWGEVYELLTKITKAFRYEDDDIKVRVILYKPLLPSSPPTIGLRIDKK